MTSKPENAVVWAEIPVTDMTRAMDFYDAVFDYGLTLDETGPNPMAFLPTANQDGIGGHIYPGKPAPEGCGPTVHLAVPDTLEAALERVAPAGGKVLSPAITIPAGLFAYVADPDGNSIGLFQYS